MVVFIGNKKKAEQAAVKVVNAILTRLASLRAPGFSLTGKDTMFIWSKLPKFCNERNITLQTVIPGHHQCLGGDEMARMHFTEITHEIIDKRTKRKIEAVDWQEYASMCTMRLDWQVRKYDVFAPGRRVSGRARTSPIGAADIPHFRDFTTRCDSPATQTRAVLAKLGEMQKSVLVNRSPIRTPIRSNAQFPRTGNRRIRHAGRSLSASGGWRK